MLTSAVARFEDGKVYLRAETLKDLVKNALIYENLRTDKELFDEFYKKLLWWSDFYSENRENVAEVKRQLEAIALWLEKKVLCGGEPEIVEGRVVNFDEEKNLLNLLKAEDFLLKEGELVKKKVKLVGRAKRFVGVRKFAEKGSMFEGLLSTDEEKVSSYERHAEKPTLFEVFKNDGLLKVVNRFSLKVLETDKEFFSGGGYSVAVKLLEEIEAESNERLVKLNYKAGTLPYGAELFVYERIETSKGRKEYSHLNRIMEEIASLGWASEIFNRTRELTFRQEPIGWCTL